MCEMGKVLETFEEDGCSCEHKIGSGWTLKRPIQLFSPLEVST